MNNLLRAAGLAKTYRKGAASVEVLRDLDVDVAPGECVAIVGESGAGKSTLLHILGALSRPTSGEVWYRETALGGLGETALADFRNHHVGFIFQFHYLLPEFTALENVMMPLRMKGESADKSRARASELLSAVGLSHRVTHRPPELSGGEQQRVAIARAMVGSPDLVLADEPTGNLDLDTARSVFKLLFQVTKEGKRSLVVATHNVELAALADRVLRLRDGKLHAERTR